MTNRGSAWRWPRAWHREASFHSSCLRGQKGKNDKKKSEKQGNKNIPDSYYVDWCYLQNIKYHKMLMFPSRKKKAFSIKTGKNTDSGSFMHKIYMLS